MQNMSDEQKTIVAEILANRFKASKHEDSIFVPVQMMNVSELYDIADEIINTIQRRTIQ